MYSMSVTLVMGFAILAAFALGFLCGRIWQIRCDELERRAGFAPPTVTRIPRPSDTEISGQASASATRSRSTTDNRPDQSGTADLFAKSTAAAASRLAKGSASVTSRRTSPEHLMMREP
jgi:hypothetical protein